MLEYYGIRFITSLQKKDHIPLKFANGINLSLHEVLYLLLQLLYLAYDNLEFLKITHICIIVRLRVLVRYWLSWSLVENLKLYSL